MGIDTTKNVEVYFNLRDKMFSVRQNGRVVMHTPYVVLKDCTFVVQPAGNARVRKEQQKNIHAFVRGKLSSAQECNDEREAYQSETEKIVDVGYNPYLHTTFVDTMGNPIHSAEWVDLFVFNNRPDVIAFGKVQ